MTISYAQEVPTVDSAFGFLRLLKIWKGSLLKAIWKDLLLYILLFSGISILYRYVLSEHEDLKKPFEIMCVYCGRFSKLIPLSFLLGFYVSLVVTRWWSQFTTLAWPDTLAMSLMSYLPGPGEAREIRRAVVRWACVCNILALRMVSPVVSKRFPTYQTLADVGLLTQKERDKLANLYDKVDGKHSIVWYPIQWAQAILQTAFKKGIIKSDIHYWALTRECEKISSLNGTLICYGWINIPLVYTQVVTIAVYTYFLASLFGAQYLSPTQYLHAGNKYIKLEKEAVTINSVNMVGYDTSLVDSYIPIFNILEFVFYMGWLQVAVTLINPFGEDDEDFDVNYLIDRNIQIGLFMVEEPEEEVVMEPWPNCSLAMDTIDSPDPGSNHVDIVSLASHASLAASPECHRNGTSSHLGLDDRSHVGSLTRLNTDLVNGTRQKSKSGCWPSCCYCCCQSGTYETAEVPTTPSIGSSCRTLPQSAPSNRRHQSPKTSPVPAPNSAPVTHKGHTPLHPSPLTLQNNSPKVVFRPKPEGNAGNGASHKPVSPKSAGSTPKAAAAQKLVHPNVQKIKE